MKDESIYPSDEDDQSFGALTFPIYQTSSFELPRGERYRYSRENNPTVEALAHRIALLENMEMGNCFSSGMSAITTTLMTFLRPGKKIIIQRELFARSFRFINDFLRQWGVNVEVSSPGTENVLKKIDEKTDMVFLETITNPLLRFNDLGTIAEKCHENHARLVADSTFATPVNIKCGDVGVDISIHSASKFLGGHNDLIAGVLSGKRELVNEIDLGRRNFGGSLDPHTSFLVMRGIKTLSLRMQRINETAMKVARFLNEELKVDTIYPGLETHPDHEAARKNLKGFGGIVTVNLHCSADDALKRLSLLSMIKPANTLGGLTTTITHPYTMSHRGLSLEEKRMAGIDEGLLRLSVGIENADDIIADLSGLVNAKKGL